MHESGVAGTTLEDVKVAAEVSGSQMYHYFPDKNELVQAVIDYQADTIVNHHRQALSSANGVEAWRNMVITAAKRTKAKGGCPLGSLAGQLAESDPEARALIAAGFDQWAAAISDGLRSLHADGKLPSDIDPDDLATTLLATLEGGILLSQVLRSTPSVRDCGRYPSRPCHRRMSPTRVRSQRSPKSAYGCSLMHVHPHHPLADPLPFVMRDTSSPSVGCSGLAFRELIQPTLTARASWTWTGLVKMDGIR